MDMFDDPDEDSVEILDNSSILSDIMIVDHKKKFFAPQDVWLLCNPKLIVNKMNLFLILWVDQSDLFHQLQKKMRREFHFSFIMSVKDAKKYIDQNLVQTIIINADFDEEDIKIIQESSIKNVLLLYKTGQQFKGLCKNVKSYQLKTVCTLEDQHNDISRILTEQFYSPHTALPNFIELSNQELLKFNKKRMTLYSIEDPQGNQSASFQDFYEICRHLSVFEDDLQQMRKLKENFKIPQQMLIYYTKERDFYRVINRSLKIIDNPLQAAWFRFPYTKLRKAISQRHIREKETTFEVYRGTYIAQKQAIGLVQNRIYQNLGFLSTSKKMTVARGFAKNCFLTIFVDDPKRESNGFCTLQGLASIQAEAQILFNTNNLFQVMYSKKIKEMWHINLKMLNNPPQELKNSFGQYQQYKTADQGFAIQEFDFDASILFYKIKLKLLQTAKKEKKTNLQFADTICDIGDVYERKGKNDLANQQFKKALSIYQQTVGKYSYRTARAFNKLAYIYCLDEKYNQALELAEEALKIFQTIKNQRSIQATKAKNNLAHCHKMREQYDTALRFYKETLQIRQEIYGPEDVMAMDILHDMATCYKDLAKYDQALQMFHKVLSIRIRVHGKGHYLTAVNIRNIAKIYKIKGNYNKALEKHKQALQIYKNIQYYHVDTAQSINHVANCFSQMQQHDSALLMYKEAFEIFLHIFGKKHKQTAQMMNNIATAYFEKGEIEQALQQYKQAKIVFQQIFISDNYQIANLYGNIGNCFNKKEEYEKAIQFYLKAIQLNSKNQDISHIQRALFIINLSICYEKIGEYDQYLKFSQEAAKIFIHILGQQHISTINSLINVSYAYFKKGDAKNCMQYYFKAIKIEDQSISTGQIQKSVDIIFQQAVKFLQQFQFELALKSFQIVLGLKEKIYGQINKSMTNTILHIVYIYYCKEEYEKIIIYFNKLFPGKAENVTRQYLIQTIKKDPQQIFKISSVLDFFISYNFKPDNFVQLICSYAVLFLNGNHLDQLEQICNKTIVLIAQYYDKGHGMVIGLLHGIANLYEAKGFVQKSKQFRDQAISIYINSQDVGQ